MVKLRKLSEVRPHNLTTIYGMPGKGKTKLISSMPGKILVADADNGLSTIIDDVETSGKQVDVATIETWDDFLDVLAEAKNYDSLAIDHLTKIQQLLYEYLIDNDKKAKRMTLQLYGVAKEEMVSVIDTLVRLANKGKNVYVICQEKQINLEADMDEDVPKIITADLQSSIRDYLLASCSLVANARTYTKKVKVDGKPKKIVEYGIQLKDTNIYTLKVRTPKADSVPERVINPTWDVINKLLGVTEAPVEIKKKSTKKKTTKKEDKE